MTATETAYRTADPAVIQAYRDWKATAVYIQHQRNALADRVGRELWVNGTGYSTHVVGFGRLDTDGPGDLLMDGALIVSTKRGQYKGLVVPNLRRKAGKEFVEELKAYTVPPLTLRGQPDMHVYVQDGLMYIGSPILWLWEGMVFALWPCDDAPVKENWERIPMSTYHLAREQYEAGQVSRNKENPDAEED